MERSRLHTPTLSNTRVTVEGQDEGERERCWKNFKASQEFKVQSFISRVFLPFVSQCGEMCVHVRLCTHIYACVCVCVCAEQSSVVDHAGIWQSIYKFVDLKHIIEKYREQLLVFFVLCSPVQLNCRLKGQVISGEYIRCLSPLSLSFPLTSLNTLSLLFDSSSSSSSSCFQL